MIELGVFEKIEYKDMVYYIHHARIAAVVKRVIHNPDMGNSRSLMEFAEFVVDKRTNQLVKCRYSLEQLFDKVLM